MKQNEREFLVELLRWSGAADTREIRGHTSATRQSCKNKGWAEYDGHYWRITKAGRSALHETQVGVG